MRHRLHSFNLLPFCLYLNHDENSFSAHVIPIAISLILCFVNVIFVAFETDSVMFNPHPFNKCNLWCCRLLFRTLDVSVRLFSITLLWLTVGVYFVALVMLCDFLYIFVSCIRLQLTHKGILNKPSSNDILSPSNRSNRSIISLAPAAGVRISNEYNKEEFLYRANSIGRMTTSRIHLENLSSDTDDDDDEEGAVPFLQSFLL